MKADSIREDGLKILLDYSYELSKDKIEGFIELLSVLGKNAYLQNDYLFVEDEKKSIAIKLGSDSIQYIPFIMYCLYGPAGFVVFQDEYHKSLTLINKEAAR